MIFCSSFPPFGLPICQTVARNHTPVPVPSHRRSYYTVMSGSGPRCTFSNEWVRTGRRPICLLVGGAWRIFAIHFRQARQDEGNENFPLRRVVAPASHRSEFVIFITALMPLNSRTAVSNSPPCCFKERCASVRPAFAYIKSVIHSHPSRVALRMVGRE